MTDDNLGEFAEFYRQEFVPLVAYVRRTGFGLAQAEDAAQEAMAEAFSCWTGLTNPRAWLRTVAYRIAVSQARRIREGTVRAAGEVPASHYCDVDAVELAEDRHQLLRDLATLPSRQRLVMAWHLDGFNNAEISRSLAISPATVRSNLRHARAALKALFSARRQEGYVND